MIWVLCAVQTALIAATVWLYINDYVQKKYDSFWNSEIGSALCIAPLVAIVTIVIAVFFMTDYTWLFLLFTIVWFLFCIYLMPQSRAIGERDSFEIEDAKVKDHISAVAKMFDMRRTIYRRLYKERAKKTLMCELWDSTEALIANAVEFNEVLKNDGYTESESIKKLLLSAQPTPGNGSPDLMSYLRFRLEKINPEYLSLGDEFLNQAVEIAKEAAEIEMKKRANNKGLETPSTEHLVAKFSYGDLINGSIFDYEGRKNELPYCTLPPHEYEGKRDWARFQIRAKPGDEIWVYLKPFFFFFIEKAALVRQGNVIDIVTAESPAVTLRINT